MNDDPAKVNGKAAGQPACTDQELFELLLEQYDEASAAGQTPRVLDDTRLPDELRQELNSLGRFVAALNAAAWQSGLTMFDRDAEPEGPSPARLTATPAEAKDLFAGLTDGTRNSLVGEKIDRFQIVRELGRGGSGVVFLGHDPSIDREVALKLPRPEALVTPELRRRFLREARAAGRLNHPHVMTVHEAGEDGALCYLVSAYCRGPSLAHWLSRHEERIGGRDAAQIVACLADGLEHSHHLGVLHRDIKPANVLLDVPATEQHTAEQELVARPLSSFVPKLTDFGLAKLVRSTDDETRTPAVLGTPAYMAPEQADSKGEQRSGAADIYGLGALLYELLTHRPPFRGRTNVETLRQVLHEDPVWPTKLRPDLPCDLEAICLKCLAKDPEKRYATAGDLAADLRRFLNGEPTLAKPLSAVHRLASWARRRPALASLIAVSIAAAAVVVAISLMYAQHLKDSNVRADLFRAQAERSAATAQQQSYVATVRTAQGAWEMNHFRIFSELLSSYEESDLRGFEWYYLKHLWQRRRIRLHPQQLVEVDGVAFAPDGKEAATANRNGIIDVWQADSGQRLTSFRAHEVCANLLRYSPDGAVLATASCDATIRLWDAKSYKLIREIRNPGGPIRTFQFDPHNEKIYSAGDEPRARMWDVASGEHLGFFEAGPDILQCLALNEDGSMLAAGGQGNRVFVWETKTGTLLTDVSTRQGRETLAVQFIGSEPLLAVSEVSNLVRIVSVPKGQSYHDFSIHGVAHSFATSPDGRKLYCATDAGVVDVCDLDRREVTATIPLHVARLSDIAVSPAGRRLMTSSFDKTAAIVEIDEFDHPERFERLGLPYDQISASAVNARVAKLAIAYNGEAQNSVVVRSIDDKEDEIRLPRQATWPVDWLEFSSDGDYLALRTNASPEQDEIWRIADRPLLVQVGQTIQSPGSDDPRDPYLVTKNSSGVVSIIDTKTGKKISVLEFGSPVHVLDIRPGKRWIIGLVNNMVRVWDVRRQQMLRPFANRGAVKVAVLSPGGNFLAAGGQADLCLYEFPSAEAIHGLIGHEGAVYAIAFSPDSKTVATGGEGKIVRLWSVATGREMLKLTGHSVPIVGLAFSKDGKTLLSLAGAQGGGKMAEAFYWRAQ